MGQLRGAPALGSPPRGSGLPCPPRGLERAPLPAGPGACLALSDKAMMTVRFAGWGLGGSGEAVLRALGPYLLSAVTEASPGIRPLGEGGHEPAESRALSTAYSVCWQGRGGQGASKLPKWMAAGGRGPCLCGQLRWPARAGSQHYPLPAAGGSVAKRSLRSLSPPQVRLDWGDWDLHISCLLTKNMVLAYSTHTKKGT